MKKLIKRIIFLLSLMTVIALACNSGKEKSNTPSQNEIVKNIVEEYLKTKLNDPDSYEFVALQLFDSVTYRDNVEQRRGRFTGRLEYDQERLNSQLRYQKTIPSMYKEDEVQKFKMEIKRNSFIISKIDSLETAMGTKVDDVASYTYLFKFRATNSFGAKVLNEYVVQTDPSPTFAIHNMTDEKDKISLSPNDFPGYLEMIRAVK